MVVVRMTGNEIRRIVLEHSYRNGTSHIGSCLSIADIMAVLYSGVLRPQDRFILSKGHAALALYAALYLCDEISGTQLAVYAREHGHPDYHIPGVTFSTGSLGMGITYAVGVAEALKRQGSDGKVYCLVSDAECQEGSFWEAARVASGRKLGNLIVVVDDNASGALGSIASDVRDKLVAFGFDAWEVPNISESIWWHLEHAFPPNTPGGLVVCTTLGKGVSFMENQLAWHYKSLDEEQYRRAMAELV